MPIAKLLVGLGNPGPTYRFTRHNAGALFVENFATVYRAPPFRLSKKFQAYTSRLSLTGAEVLLALPQTFMNLSGESVSRLVNFYRLKPATALLVAFDDLDLPFGSFKFSQSAPRGHNGIISLRQALPHVTFTCLRLGSDDRAGERTLPPADYVLQNFTALQQAHLVSQVFPAARRQLEQTWL